MEITTSFKHQFRPFQLIINIDSVSDMEVLMSYFNASQTARQKFANDNKPDFIERTFSGNDVANLAKCYHLLEAVYEQTVSKVR